MHHFQNIFHQKMQASSCIFIQLVWNILELGKGESGTHITEKFVCVQEM